MRKLAEIVIIDKIIEHSNADALEIAKIGGWQCVVKKGEFQAGDEAIYVQIDSFVPMEVAPFLVKNNKPHEFNGIQGERLRTIKLRGELSQGLLLSTSILKNSYKVGDDVSEELGIVKYEPPIPAALQGDIRGNFPSHLVAKTDEDRVQSLELSDIALYSPFTVTEKLDGTSMTIVLYGDNIEVCSRNLSLKETENNTYWNVTRRDSIEEKLRDNGYHNIALQGELIGPGIQKNLYKLNRHEFFVFRIVDIKERYTYSTEEVEAFCKKLDLNMVPIIHRFDGILFYTINYTYENFLSIAQGKSLLNFSQEREGVVFTSSKDSNYHFKAISNKFLLKHEE